MSSARSTARACRSPARPRPRAACTPSPALARRGLVPLRRDDEVLSHLPAGLRHGLDGRERADADSWRVRRISPPQCTTHKRCGQTPDRGSVDHRPRIDTCASTVPGAAASDATTTPAALALPGPAWPPTPYPNNAHGTGSQDEFPPAGRGAFDQLRLAFERQATWRATSRRSATSRPRASPARRRTRSATSCPTIDLIRRPQGLPWGQAPLMPITDSRAAVRPGEHACSGSPTRDRGASRRLRLRGAHARRQDHLPLRPRSRDARRGSWRRTTTAWKPRSGAASSTSARRAPPTRRRATSTWSACPSRRATNAIARSPRADPALSFTARWVVDVSLPGHERLAEYERRLAELMERAGLITLCLYNAAGPLGPATLSDVAAAHEVDLSPELAALSRTGRSRRAHRRGPRAAPRGRPRLRVRRRPRRGPRRPLPRPAVLDLADLDFVDVTGMRALRGRKGQRLMISGASAPVRRMLQMLAWDTDRRRAPRRMARDRPRHERPLRGRRAFADDAAVFLEEASTGERRGRPCSRPKLGVRARRARPRRRTSLLNVDGHYTRPEAALAELRREVRTLGGTAPACASSASCRR